MKLNAVIDKLSSFGFSAVFCGTQAAPAWEIQHGYVGAYPSREAVSVHEAIRSIAERAGLHVSVKGRFASTIIAA